MDKSLESKCHELESSYWWFIARRDMLFGLVKGMDKNLKILEVGCSSGKFLGMLRKSGFRHLYGVDISKEAIAKCRDAKLDYTYVMDGAKLKFKPGTFDLVIASDVLEHIKDESAALNEWKRVLKKNGKLIVFVPAFSFLWDNSDVLNHHYRRYGRKRLLRVLSKEGFRVQRCSYWNCMPFFPVACARIFGRIFGSKADELYSVSNLTNKTLVRILKLENRLLRRISLPVGVSVFAIAEK